jgi:hypothetical protein
MKVFISWSGSLSKRLGEAIRDWLPGVLQLVSPYFTPSDIEKGTRWSTEIAKELSDSQIGILCVTQDNLHSDWILFEAGALSKSLEKSHVCPILFGITNTDLAGPLKQFQTTEFNRGDIHKLIGVINSRLGENKLPSKTLDVVFEKWYPDLEVRVNEILGDVSERDTPIRSDREILEEILQLSRVASRRPNQSTSIAPGAVTELLTNYIELHDQQVREEGGYQDTLESIKRMHRAVEYIVKRYLGASNEMDELIGRFRDLSYEVKGKEEKNLDDDIPF